MSRSAHAVRPQSPPEMDRLLRATYKAEGSHFWWIGFRGFVEPLVIRATAGMTNPTILDCGCGTGANVAFLSKYGRAFGFDLSHEGPCFARSYGQRRIARASIGDIPFAQSTFHLVTAFDVLYSLPEEVEERAVREMVRVLRPGGYAIVNVAALNILRGNHSIFGGEVRRSTRKRLRWVLTRGGFTVERLTYTNASIFPIVLAIRTAQRLSGLASPDKADTDLAIPPRPINAALSALLRAEAVALRRFDMPIGSSLLALARKPS